MNNSQHKIQKLGRPERKQLYYHSVIASRLKDHPEWIDQAKTNLVRIGKINPNGAFFHRQWDVILDQCIDDIVDLLCESSTEMSDLRQETPFTGMIDKRERVDILKRFSIEDAL